jgi:hypothetical protein
MCSFDVGQVDPDLGRTVLVSTKLDTRIPQFARPDDVELFLRPQIRLLNGNALGAFPFFTSVPSGRVGSSLESVFRSNAHFQEVHTKPSIKTQPMFGAIYLLFVEPMAHISLEVYGYNFLQAGGMADNIALVLAIDLYKRKK